MSEINLIYEEEHCRYTENTFLRSISNILEELIQETDIFQIKKSLFHSEKLPNISLENYLIRIVRYTKCSKECLLIALIYLYRIQELNQEQLLNKQSVHRFLIIAIVLAIKYQDDDIYGNDYYAKVGGITMQELNDMEKEFLDRIEFQLFIDQDHYYFYQQKINQFSRL
ncbi:unnamed protein product [Paramecium sonneborni]|uniref:Cyclin n=1 Tax=Paramecium sonneborni TaxID=65129 RepID=A0A8S1R8W1_9CILI|nr:unnamed protein product [Paramecium sonneborni]